MRLENYEPRDSEMYEQGMEQMHAEILQLKNIINPELNRLSESIIPSQTLIDGHAGEFDINGNML